MRDPAAQCDRLHMTNVTAGGGFVSALVPRHGTQAAVCAGAVSVAGGGTRPGGAPTNALEFFMLSAYAPCDPPNA